MISARVKSIAEGRRYTVYPDSNGDAVMFEGSRAACLRFIRQTGHGRAYRRGEIRIGQTLWESREQLEEICAYKRDKQETA